LGDNCLFITSLDRIDGEDFESSRLKQNILQNNDFMFFFRSDNIMSCLDHWNFNEDKRKSNFYTSLIIRAF